MIDGAHMRILLVEDNIVNQKVMQQMLKILGYPSDQAFNGHEALEALKRESYDVVLMDIAMPVMDGMEATKIIRQNEEKGPWIIAVTACAYTKDECLDAGMNDYLTKPVSLNDLKIAFLKVNQASLK
jgi:two-component system sensor histidine kinase/response regulator